MIVYINTVGVQIPFIHYIWSHITFLFIYSSVHLSTCLSVHASILLFICPSSHLFIHRQSIHRSIFYLSIRLSIYSFIYLSIHLSIYLSIHHSIYLSIQYTSIYVFIHLSICPSIHLSAIYLSICSSAAFHLYLSVFKPLRVFFYYYLPVSHLYCLCVFTFIYMFTN